MLVFTLILDSRKYCVHQFLLYQIQEVYLQMKLVLPLYYNTVWPVTLYNRLIRRHSLDP